MECFEVLWKCLRGWYWNPVEDELKMPWNFECSLRKIHPISKSNVQVFPMDSCHQEPVSIWRTIWVLWGGVKIGDNSSRMPKKYITIWSEPYREVIFYDIWTEFQAKRSETSSFLCTMSDARQTVSMVKIFENYVHMLVEGGTSFQRRPKNTSENEE